MTVDRAEVVAGLTRTLRSARNADGGWAYFVGKSSRLEPTCWAILSLLDSGAEFPLHELDASLTLLSRWQQRDGLLSDTPGAPQNLAFNGLAALVISLARERHPAAAPGLQQLEARLLDSIRTETGVQYRQVEGQRQDNRLRGWPWIDRTFSWLEPTAWCLLALKRSKRTPADPRVDSRIDEAERCVLDRCCLSGGWNFGTSNTLGKELHPYVPTTALGLLALQDRRETPEVIRSLRWLREHEASEPSATGLSMALVAARVFGQPGESLDARLQELVATTKGLGNLATTALALYALTSSVHGTEAVNL